MGKILVLKRRRNIITNKRHILSRNPDEVFAELQAIHPEFIISGDYINNRTKLHVKCADCGYEWDSPSYTLKISKGCPQCVRRRRGVGSRKSHDEFIKQVSDVLPDVEIQSEYVTSKSRIQCECRKCGHRWEAYAYNLYSGYGCRKCGREATSASQRLDINDVVRRIADIDDSIEVIGEYKSNRDNLLCKCTRCGNTWNGMALNLFKGEGCPYCSMPRGEKRIAKWLNKNGVEYKCCKKFDDLRNEYGNKLSYDFFIPSQNLLIEYQGIQHEHPVNQFGGEAQFVVQQKHDKQKAEYAIQNGYNILIIWYYDYKNIDNLLNEYFNTNVPVTTKV